MKYALIGCGRISPNHIAAAIENKLEISAVCDIAKENMAALLGKFGLQDSRTAQYTDYRLMLAEQRPQLAAVCTESGRHAKIALDCLNAGSNVIIEKPIALSLADADAIIKTAAQKKLVVSACHQNRFNKSVQRLRRSVENGDFGRLYYGVASIRWNRSRGYYAQAPWRGTWQQDGGALMNQCIHNIDLLRWMLGDGIDEVCGTTANFAHPYIQTEDFGSAIVKFTNGAVGIIEGTTAIYPANLEETLSIFGEKGSAIAGGKSVNVLEHWQVENQNSGEIISLYRENPPNVYGFGHTPLYADVIDAIKNSRQPYVDGCAGKRAVELVLGVYLSSKTGRPVKFPLKECDTMMFAE